MGKTCFIPVVIIACLILGPWGLVIGPIIYCICAFLFLLDEGGEEEPTKTIKTHYEDGEKITKVYVHKNKKNQ